MAVDGEWCGARIGFGTIRTAGRGSPHRSLRIPNTCLGNLQRRLRVHVSWDMFAADVATKHAASSCREQAARDSARRRRGGGEGGKEEEEALFKGNTVNKKGL